MKKKYKLIAFFLLIIILIGYHFFAAHQAEIQLDEAIQRQVKKAAHAVSIQYSSINISPFRGDIDFKNVTTVQDSAIERSTSVHIDLTYLDFLAIYFGGMNYALKHLSGAMVTLGHPSFVNRPSLREIRLDTLRLTYQGNAWDALRNVITHEQLDYIHHFSLAGTGFRYAQPESAIGSFKADSLIYYHSTPDSPDRLMDGKSTIKLRSITWIPPQTFQQKYAFIIRGFNYNPGAIPISEAFFSLHSTHTPPNIHLTKGEIKAILCTIHTEGSFTPEIPMKNTRINALKISLTNPSEQFQRVLKNAEQMFNLRLPKENNLITFQVTGTAGNPRLLTQH